MSRCSCRSCHPCRFPMRPLLKVFVLFGLLIWVTGSSKAQDKVEVYGGYSYLHASVQVGQHNFVGLPPLPPVTQHGNLNGWELAGQYKFLPFLGAVVDFNGNYGGVDGGSTRVHTFLFGPQVSLPTKVSPFAHALIGVAKESQENNFSGACPVVTRGCRFSLGTDTSLATAIGAGFDIKLVPFVKLRLIQVDYLRTQLHGATQNQARASAGIVFHF